MKLRRAPVFEGAKNIEAEFGRRLCAAREKARLNLDEAAALVGLSRSSLSAIERGVTRVALSDALVLANVLEFKLDEIPFPIPKKEIFSWVQERLLKSLQKTAQKSPSTADTTNS